MKSNGERLNLFNSMQRAWNIMIYIIRAVMIFIFQEHIFRDLEICDLAAAQHRRVIIKKSTERGMKRMTVTKS